MRTFTLTSALRYWCRHYISKAKNCQEYKWISMFTVEWVDAVAAKGVPPGQLGCILANRNLHTAVFWEPCIFWPTRTSHSGRRMMYRTEIGGTAVGWGSFQMKRLLISNTVPIQGWSAVCPLLPQSLILNFAF